MTDSIRVFDPGYRVTDQNGLLVPGAVIKFYNAGTTTPRAVYSNSGLSTSLSDTVTCNASGAPAASDGTLVLIYTGTTAYKVEIYDSGGALVPGMTFDNVSGALDTSIFNVTATVAWEVVPISATGTIPSGNLGKLENVNPTAGQVARTLPTAASAGLGSYIWIRHDGTANAVLVLSQGSELIHARGDLGSRQCITLFEKGDSVLLVSDAVDWHAQFTPNLHRNKLFTVKGMQSTPPASPVAGDAYIATGTPTGAWSSFAANDVLTADGNAGWYRQRPPYDCGWVAYYGGYYYRYIAASWRSEQATTTTYGTLTVATQADQESLTANYAAVTPSAQQYHPSAAKAVLLMLGNGTIAYNYGIASCTRSSLGTYVVTLTTAFSSTNFAVTIGVRGTSATNPNGLIETARTASTLSFSIYDMAGGSGSFTLSDPTRVSLSFFGDV